MSFTCQHACVSIVYVPTCQNRVNFSFLHAYVTINVPTCYTACECFNSACKRANGRVSFSTWRANVPKGMPVFQTFLSRDAKGNFYTLSLYKKLQILIDVIVMNIICIYIVNKNCIIVHFVTSCHIKEKCLDFFFFFNYFFLFCSLVRS